MGNFTRKTFVKRLIGSSAGLFVLPHLAVATVSTTRPLTTATVKEFVSVAHKDLEKVTSMLAENPDLLHASHNWKEWDWEDAIGAAGHMGLPNIASFLLEKGARPTICVAAMLGQTAIVKAYVLAYPQMKDAVGPHRISLLRHARAGGEPAREVQEYLVSVGARE